MIPVGSVKAKPVVPIVTDFFDATGKLTQHIVYVGQDGFVHNDGFDPKAGTWFDQIPPGSVRAQSSPNAATTFNDTFQVVYFGTDRRVHHDVFNQRTGSWSDTIPTGSVAPAGVLPAVANTDI